MTDYCLSFVDFDITFLTILRLVGECCLGRRNVQVKAVGQK